ncbi:tRNA (5-methylaminomethyl-2-thiouridine)(34)-methyltransferase MnmD [Winogradskyella haliclonae]|uniref:MnmC-like methyltransferase domain-containing protein n=1 Tax=Winogradskyella haliclonae TaxID=2048558 RepID=A0ABQ2C1N8_9FLAO|nr:tRNA (5-methylaminomethyl-2-thiouridine)(34)-methyltransferase MnmD [Winogradskyella haliclonae]GGI58145.1 hypothetical protein GCM10011444_24540 [Winogradskyella haliclonae]
MQRKIITTGDGSKTIHIEEWNEQYHSVHGAINEANHVYLKHGLLFFLSQISKNREVSILEIGFGTGLNAFLTLIEAEKRQQKINYTGVEAYPVKQEEIEILNYPELISTKYKEEFYTIHDSTWEEQVKISKNFSIIKEQKLFEHIADNSKYDIVYFDAFGARVQPELWTETIFRIMYKAMKSNAVLVTYSAKGSVKRALKSVGFEIERLEGPPNKRHMLRAVKR